MSRDFWIKKPVGSFTQLDLLSFLQIEPNKSWSIHKYVPWVDLNHADTYYKHQFKILRCLWALILTKSHDCWRLYKRLCTSDNRVVRSGGYITTWAWKQVDPLVTPDAAVSQTSVFSYVHSTKTPHLSPSQLCTSETWQMCPHSWRQTTNASILFYTCGHVHVKSQIQRSHQFFLGLWAPFPPPRRNKYRCQVFSLIQLRFI